MKTAKLFSGLLILLILISFHNAKAQWILDSTGMGNKSVLSLSVSGNIIFAGTLGSGVYVSNDTGSTWLHSSLISQNFWSMAVSGTSIFAATDNDMGVYKSTNIGGNWVQTLNNQTAWSLLVKGTTIFAGTENNGIFVSTNDGMNWSQTALNTNSVHALAANGNNIFAGTFSNGVYLSTDNGASWNQTSLGSPAIVNAFAMDGNIIFAGTQTSGVLRSTNNGTNWTQTPLTQYVRSLAAFGRNIFAGIQNGGVFISNDDGVSWTQRNEGLENSSVDALYIYNNNNIFAGSEDGAINGFYKRPLAELIGIKQISEQVPERFTLSQNYPNPFNPTTKIRFSLPKNSFVLIIVYDMLGREIETIVNQQLNAGTYEANWNAERFSSGIYYYKLITGHFEETKKMALIK